MKIYRRTPGITVGLRKATARDLLHMEIRYPDDPLLPTLSSQEAWVMTVGERNQERPVGFIEYFTRERDLTVTGLWVAPDLRGNGYGTMMLELVEDIEKPSFMRVITTPQSRGFYKKRGYDLDQGFSVFTKVILNGN